MDPDACLSELFDALAEGDYSTATDRAEALSEWIGKGGFYPGGGKLREGSVRVFLIWVSGLEGVK